MKSPTHFLKYGAVTLLGLGLATDPANAISITPTSDGSQLVNTVVGEGITVDPSDIRYNGASGASGTFTDGLSEIGMGSGIILTTGDASLAAGPNDSDGSTGINNLPGDDDLNSLVPQASTRDATVLEFDFTTEGGDLFFNYAFASEEYNEYTNSAFNDVFGFFLDGENIALIPGTTTPVAINNVNGGNPLGTDASNPELYNNNERSDGSPFNIEYDGFTDVFTAQAPGIGAGEHTIKLAIADVGDSRLDSAVFIQGGTFSDQQTETVQATTFSDQPTQSVPEPLTGLGSGLAIGFGAWLQRNHSRRHKKKQSIA
jgi:hypothetical protein